jgi:DNA gyrase subunit B
LTFFYRQMPQLIEHGYIYIAQPPLYKVTRRKREEYVESDAHLTQILLDLGADGLLIEKLDGSQLLDTKGVRELLQNLVEIEDIADKLRRRGIRLEDFLSHRNVETGEFPFYCAYMNELGEDLDIRFAHDDHDLQAIFAEVQQGLEPVEGEEPAAPTIRYKELFFSKQLKAVIERLEQDGFSLSQLTGSEKPQFNINDKGTKIEANALMDLLAAVRELGRKGMSIQRYKGLGEMNPQQLWETTLDPEFRRMTKVVLDDVVKADEMFTILMGDEVEPRREFIQDNALNVTNLDI